MPHVVDKARTFSWVSFTRQHPLRESSAPTAESPTKGPIRNVTSFRHEDSNLQTVADGQQADRSMTVMLCSEVHEGVLSSL